MGQQSGRPKVVSDGNELPATADLGRTILRMCEILDDVESGTGDGRHIAVSVGNGKSTTANLRCFNREHRIGAKVCERTIICYFDIVPIIAPA